MSVLDADELALIQADLAEQVCDKTCEVWRGTQTKDQWGNASIPDDSYTLLSTTKAGMQQPSATLLTNYAYRVGSLNSWHVLLPHGTDVAENDHLVIENFVLNVHVLLDPHSVPGLTPTLAAEIK
jgi:hypothetical protein